MVDLSDLKKFFWLNGVPDKPVKLYILTLAGAPYTHISDYPGCIRWRTYLLLRNEDGHGRVEPRAEDDGGSPLNLELVHNPLRPLCRAEDLNLLRNKTDRVRLRNGVLQIPSLQRLLRKRNELLAGGDGEHPQVLVLRAVL